MRPRSFKPNILNIPRYVTDYIKNGFKKVIKYFNIELDEDGKVKPGYDEENFRSIVEELRTIYNIKEDITINELVPAPMRWCFKAPEGYCFVDADYATAEVWTIAYLSGDKNLINTLTKPDPQFAFLKMPDGKEKQVRIAYIDEIVEFTEDAKDPSLLHDPNDPNLVRNPDGTLKHPKQDVHWVAVENKYMLNTPREKLDKNKTRDAAGKVSNFSIPYGASPSLLERSIEIASGEKPEKGTGEKLIEAYMKTKPQVAEFLEWCKTLPDGQGYYLSPSGFKRHFKVPPEDLMMSDRQREGIISKLRREACNIGLQSLVADSLARAVPPLNNFFRKMNMKSRVVIPLYDAIYILAPFNEVDTAARMLKFFMSENNKWNLKGGTLQYGIDVEITKRWGTKPSKEEKEELKNGLKNAGQKMEV